MMQGLRVSRMVESPIVPSEWVRIRAGYEQYCVLYGLRLSTEGVDRSARVAVAGGRLRKGSDRQKPVDGEGALVYRLGRGLFRRRVASPEHTEQATGYRGSSALERVSVNYGASKLWRRRTPAAISQNGEARRPRRRRPRLGRRSVSIDVAKDWVGAASPPRPATSCPTRAPL